MQNLNQNDVPTKEQLEQMTNEANDIIQKSMDMYQKTIYFEQNGKFYETYLDDTSQLSEKVIVKISTNGNNALIPKYQTDGASGMDVYANILEPIILKPLERRLIPTGVFVQLPPNYEFELRPRSGLALKKGLSLLNGIGTIDEDYRLEIGAIIVNLSSEEVTIEPMERIAQMVLSKVEKCHWEKIENSDDLSKTNRKGGYGSTGFK